MCQQGKAIPLSGEMSAQQTKWFPLPEKKPASPGILRGIFRFLLSAIYRPLSDIRSPMRRVKKNLDKSVQIRYY